MLSTLGEWSRHWANGRDIGRTVASKARSYRRKDERSRAKLAPTEEEKKRLMSKVLHTHLTPKQLTIFEIFIEFTIGCQDEFCTWVR